MKFRFVEILSNRSTRFPVVPLLLSLGRFPASQILYLHFLAKFCFQRKINFGSFTPFSGLDVCMVGKPIWQIVYFQLHYVCSKMPMPFFSFSDLYKCRYTYIYKGRLFGKCLFLTHPAYIGS
jgi:hypothetical protein